MTPREKSWWEVIDEKGPAPKAAQVASDGVYREGLAPASDASEVGEECRTVARTLRARFADAKLYPDNLNRIPRIKRA